MADDPGREHRRPRPAHPACASSRCEKKVLLIGIAKDTTATDIHRAVLPFAVEEGDRSILRSPPPSLKNDKAFLSILSAMNRELEIPWRTSGYDSAFSTMVATPRGDEFKPARKVVSREELFVRGFFQSRSLGSSGRIRSQVFLFDRAFNAELDSADVGSVEVKEASGQDRGHSVLREQGRRAWSRTSSCGFSP